MNRDRFSTIRCLRRFALRATPRPPTLAMVATLACGAWPVLAQEVPVEAPPVGQAGQAATETVEVYGQVPPEPPEWPGVDRLAAALADAGQRHDVMLTVAALMTLRDQSRSATAEEARERARAVLGNRDWLSSLDERYGLAEARSPVLDPAAWQVQVQLDRVGLDSTMTASPLGPGLDVLLGPVFDRSSPDIAAASLPELLWHLESDASLAWERLLGRLGDDPWMSVMLMELGAALFDWPGPPAAGGETGEGDSPELVLDNARESLGVMFALAADTGPPDPQRLAEVRRSLTAAMPEFGQAQRVEASTLLHLTGLVDDLYHQDWLNFTESLLAVTARLQEVEPIFPEQTRSLAAWLTDLLPGLSARFGRAFSRVDPQLNSVIATAYDVIRLLSRDVSPEELRGLRVQIADAVAVLGLMIPDLGYYFDQPIRDPVAGGVDACTGIAGRVEADGTPYMTRDLFDDCQQTLVELADAEAREAQLAGDADGPFGPSQLQRELGLTSGQRINYGIGYLHDRYETGCELPARPLANPLEWAYLATFMSWFAEQSPVFFQTPENEARLQRMRDIGRELVREIGEQVDCLSGAGATINDPVDRVTTDYGSALRALGVGLDGTRSNFRESRLAAGADVRLDETSGQSTAYRPVDTAIGPCDPNNTCEMTGELSSTRALLGLFGDPWLVADQTGLGQLEICYGDMGWVNRRMEPVRPGDENVANFFGRLAFDLRGRYSDESGTIDLFAFRFRAPEESHYLFAAQDEAVLEDDCPTEWVGTRIVTELPGGRSSIVPNRLTYLSAARALPSRLLEANWDQGAEWRDWFVTGLGVETLDVPEPPPIAPELDPHLRSLYREEQDALYGALTSGGDGESELMEELGTVSTAKLLLRTQMMLFFPQILTHSNRLREAVAGQNGLLDRRLLLRARQEDRPVDDVLADAFERLERFREDWRALPETVRRRGFIADSVSHAMVRLEAIHDQFFVVPRESQPASVPPLPGAESEGEEESDAQPQL